MVKMEPSSANTGFFQELPQLENQYYDDVSLQRIFKFFVPQELRQAAEPDLAQLGAEVLDPRIFDYVTEAERNLPYLRGSGRDVFGHPTTDLITGEGWRGLQAFGVERGMVAYNYTHDGPHARLLQMMRFYLWEASSAGTTCPGAMSDGAARILQRHLATSALEPTQRRVFQSAYDRLTSTDPARAWTSGQWMTERPGGSDVSQTETVATHVGLSTELLDADGLPLGPWSIDGFKWFSSATDANMAVLLARTQPGRPLSAFFAPMRRTPASPIRRGIHGPPASELNGVRIQRLKDKSGTRALPTAELELRGMRAWLIGREGNGIREIATVLGITRVHCAVGTLGLVARALSVARAYSLVRHVSTASSSRARQPLYKNPLHMRTLAGLTGDHHGLSLLTFYTAYVMGIEEQLKTSSSSTSSTNSLLSPPPPLVAPLLRTLSSLHKAYVCQQSVPLLHATCMETLGGVGYLLSSETEPLNLARLFRDGVVNVIWEGTTDVLSSDLLRTLTHPKTGRSGLDALAWLVHTVADSHTDTHLLLRWAELRARIEPGLHDAAARDSLLADARSVLCAAAEILIGSLLLVDARSDGSPAAATMARRFLEKKGICPRDPNAPPVSAEAGLAADTAIVYGSNGPEARVAANARL